MPPSPTCTSSTGPSSVTAAGSAWIASHRYCAGPGACQTGLVPGRVEPITTERLLLRPFSPGDLADLHAIHSQPDVVRYLYWEARSPDESRAALERHQRHDRLEREGDRLVLAVVRRDTGRLIGEVSLRWLSEEHRQGEIGFVFHPDAQGKGYAREAATAVLDLAFGALGLHRVIGRTDARNETSAALMRRLGMRQEAHFVQSEIFKGEWGDELVFAILDGEWGAARRGRT